MTVQELIGELMASCQTLDDEVWLGNVPGKVLRVEGDKDGETVFLNQYDDEDPVDLG